MNSILHAEGIAYLRIVLPATRQYHAGRAASVNTAIAKGIRKSKGLAFRSGPSSSNNPNDPRTKYLAQNPPVKFDLERRAHRRDETARNERQTSEAWQQQAGREKEPDVRIRRGIKVIKTNKQLDRKRPDPAGRSNDRKFGFGDRGSHRTGFDEITQSPQTSFGRRTGISRGEQRGAREGVSDFSSSYPKREWAPRPMELRSNSGRNSFGTSSSETKGWSPRSTEKTSSRMSSERTPRHREGWGSKSGDDTRGFSSPRERKSWDSATNGDISPSNVVEEIDKDSSVSRPRITKSMVDNRIPLSIPYTTPASEFLYGTSVVEAALTSRRVPTRQLYKLYIYTGENRERSSTDRDIDIAKLAKRNGVKVSRMNDVDGLRLMDKMSGGRPHNGYVLEASPLPRLPVTRLGEVTDADGVTGFRVTVDYQSKEDAAVNGTNDFIKLPSVRSASQPLVLLLDSIQDPGNLGGIIRTASFLGVSAVAISTRNSASFTPVVLKASAGASENITLFSVSKPEVFVQESREAGWKIFAAVAPATGRDAYYSRKSVSTDRLGEPLAEGPCILMLGGEGEGLRMNLRRKADVDVYIPGSSQRSTVDSLNVSVAAGILCSSFVKRNRISTRSNDNMDDEDEGAKESSSGDLF
jgi:21S rRNA (GM2251-2'-O)-methyltransferase